MTTAKADTMPISAPPRPSCNSCPIYEHRAVSVEAIGRGAPAGGVCHFLPEAVRKMPNDWCAQHPGMRAWLTPDPPIFVPEGTNLKPGGISRVEK